MLQNNFTETLFSVLCSFECSLKASVVLYNEVSNSSRPRGSIRHAENRHVTRGSVLSLIGSDVTDN